MSVIKARAPVTGGNFGVWGGMFSTFDCAVKGWRQKEDMWNAIISGFLTGGCLAARSEYCPTTPVALTNQLSPGGPRSALGSAVACGILLSVFEGVGVLISRVFNDNTRPQLPPRKSFVAPNSRAQLTSPPQYPKTCNHKQHDSSVHALLLSPDLRCITLSHCCHCLIRYSLYYTSSMLARPQSVIRCE